MPYKITGQRQTTIVNDSGQLTQVMEISFRTGRGVTAHVDIPLDQYSVASVAAAIEPLVTEIDNVHNLGG